MIHTSILDQIDEQGNRLAKAEADLYDLTTALSRAFDGTAKMDAEDHYLFVNDLYAANFGYTTQDLQGLPWESTVVPEDRDSMRKAIWCCRENGRAEIESRGLRKDGSIFWKKVALVRIPAEVHATYSGYYAFVRDITDSKRWATELQRSEQRFSTLVRATSAIVWVRDAHGFFSENQPSWEHFTGQTYEQYHGMGWIEAVHEDDKLRIIELWSRAVTEKTLYESELRLLRSDGVYRDMFTRAAPILDQDGSVREWIGSAEDVTDSKIYKQRYQGLTDAMPQLVWTYDGNGSLTFRNQQWYDYTGQDPLDKEKPYFYIHPEDVARVKPLWEARIQAHSGLYLAELRLRRHDGVYRWFLARATPVLNSSGEFQYWIGTCTDIEDSKKIESENAVSQARIRAIMDAALDAIITIDKSGCVVEWNPASERIFGWSSQEAMGKLLTDLIIPKSLAKAHTQGLSRFLKTGEGNILGKRLELPAQSKSGAHLDTETTVLEVKAKDAVFFTAYVRDVTEKKNNERVLHLQERTMAAAVNGIVITDCTLPDEPIIYCNPAFEKLTGYTQEEILGKNCRFIQGPNTDKKSVTKLRQAIRERKTCQVRILNYRKDGTPFWNDLTISPVLDDKGECTNYIGVQYQVEEFELVEFSPTPKDSEGTFHESS